MFKAEVVSPLVRLFRFPVCYSGVWEKSLRSPPYSNACSVSSQPQLTQSPTCRARLDLYPATRNARAAVLLPSACLQMVSVECVVWEGK